MIILIKNLVAMGLGNFLSKKHEISILMENIQMQYMSTNDLQNIKETDQFLIIPFSAQAYAKSLKLSDKATLAFFYVTALTMKRLNYMKPGSSPRIRFSLSHLLNSGLVNSKPTASKAIKELREKGVLSFEDKNIHGTSFVVNLGLEMLTLIKPRKVKKGAAKLEPVKSFNPNNQEVSPKVSDPAKVIELQKVLERLNTEITNRPSVEKPSPGGLMDMLKQARSKSSVVDDTQLALIQKRDDIQRMLNIELSKEGCNSTSVQLPVDLKPKQTRILKTISPSLIQKIISKVKQFNFVSQKSVLVNEIVWAIRFGWYSLNPEMGIMHCLNHALKLVKDNTWTTPIGFQTKQIEGLVKYAIAK